MIKFKLQVQRSGRTEWGTIQEEKCLPEDAQKTKDMLESRMAGWMSNCDLLRDSNFRIIKET